MSATNYDQRPTTSTAREVASAPWTSWRDCLNAIMGVYLALAPLWTDGAPAEWFIPLGILIAAAGIWALATVSSTTSERVQIILGTVTFLSPWLGRFAAPSGGAWTAWIIGGMVAVLAARAMRNRRMPA